MTQGDQLEEQHITTYRPNEELVVFGPEREPRASNKPINKKIKKKEDIIMEDPITRATQRSLARL
jgi:hypothetical protein